MNIAILCDDKKQFELLLEYTSLEKISATCYSDYHELIDNDKSHNLLIIDEQNKNFDVYQVCEYLNNVLSIPIIIISNEESVALEKKAFDVGCVDYIKTPYTIEVVLRRLKVHVAKLSNKHNKVDLGNNLMLDLQNNHITYDNMHIKLTTKQFKIVCYLAEHSNRIVSREEITNEIWNSEVNNNRIIDTHIKNIRKSIPQLRIDTISGSGYRYFKD